MGKYAIPQLAEILVKKNGLKPSEAQDFVSAMFDIIKEGLETDKLVKVKGFGTFKIIDVDPRESVNVNTGERVLINSHQKITFTPDSVMKEMVNRPFSQFETVVINDGVDFSKVDNGDIKIEIIGENTGDDNAEDAADDEPTTDAIYEDSGAEEDNAAVEDNVQEQKPEEEQTVKHTEQQMEESIEKPIEEPEAVQEVKDTKEEKAEKEEEILEEEVKPEPVTKEKEIEIKESATDVSSLEVVKITSIIPATFVPDSPIILEEVVIKTRTEDSFVSIKVRNISNKDFVSSTWKMDGTRDFKSNKRISSGSETTIDAIINVPTDRASFSLSSITDEEGNNLDIAERRLTLPEKLDISLLTKDDRFPFFLSSLKKKEGVDAHWLYKEDETSSFWLCPVCGIPVKKEEKCPSCALDREKAQVFSYSSLTTLFDKAKESKEE